MDIIRRFFDIIYRYKFTIIGSLLLILSVLIILNNAKIETRIETFLPGYKPGRPIEEIDDPAVQNMVRMALKFGDSANVSIIYHSEVSLNQPGALKRIKEFQEKLEKLKDVRLVISILNYPGAEAYFENDAINLKELPKELKNFEKADIKGYSEETVKKRLQSSKIFIDFFKVFFQNSFMPLKFF